MSRQLTHESQSPSQADETKNHPDYITPPALPAVVLGGGYSSDRQMATFLKCLNNGSITYNAEAKSSVLFGDLRNFNEFERDLGVDVSTSASRNLFSIDASASYARSMKDTDYTQSFYFTYKINLGTKIFNPSGYGIDALNEIGKNIYQNGTGASKFREVCGDQFVQQVTLGAGLYVTLKIYFGSISSKNNFNVKIGVGFKSIFDVTNKISQTINITQNDTKIEFYALQLGGDVSQLAKMFTEGSHPYSITNCSFNNLHNCNTSFENVFNYAANDFSKQISANGETVSGVTSAGYVVVPFSQLGIEVGESVLTDEIKEGRNYLGNAYQMLQDQLSFVDHMVHHQIFNLFNAVSRQSLNNMYEILKGYIDIFENPTPADTSVLACYYVPQKCVNISKDIHNQLIINRDFHYDIFSKVKEYSYLINVTVFQEHNQSDKIVVAQGSCIALDLTPGPCGPVPYSSCRHQTNSNYPHLYKWDCQGSTASLNITRSSETGDPLTVVYANHTYNVTNNIDHYETKAECNTSNDPILPPFNEYCGKPNPHEPPWPGGHTYIDMILQPIGLL